MIDIDALDIDDVLANSYRDFHAKGLHYICLDRAPYMTEKLYFFEGDTTNLGEVINPHDHRYDFETECLAGGVTNHTFRRCFPDGYQMGVTFDRFEWRTPLNGGDGFTWVGTDRLVETMAKHYTPGRTYQSLAHEIHTISVKEGTVLRLKQYRDRHDTTVPSNTYSRFGTPALDDLYGTWTADQLIAELRRLNEVSA